MMRKFLAIVLSILATIAGVAAFAVQSIQQALDDVPDEVKKVARVVADAPHLRDRECPFSQGVSLVAGQDHASSDNVLRAQFAGYDQDGEPRWLVAVVSDFGLSHVVLSAKADNGHYYNVTISSESFAGTPAGYEPAKMGEDGNLLPSREESFLMRRQYQTFSLENVWDGNKEVVETPASAVTLRLDARQDGECA